MGVAQGSPVGDRDDAVDRPQPAGMAAVGPDRPDVGELLELGAGGRGNASEREVHRQQRRRGRRCERDARSGPSNVADTRRRGLRELKRARRVDRRRFVGRTEHRLHRDPAVDHGESVHGRDLAEREPVAGDETLDVVPQLGAPRRGPGPRDLRALEHFRRRRRRRTVCVGWARVEAGRSVASLVAHDAPSSRDRRVAAATASRIAARRPRASSSRSPAAVVPPGEVTAARNASGPESSRASSVAEPSRV
jgi:hypothetical protein